MADLIGLNSPDMYDWAAIAGIVAFVAAELMLLALRRRSIMGYLGQ